MISKRKSSGDLGKNKENDEDDSQRKRQRSQGNNALRKVGVSSSNNANAEFTTRFKPLLTFNGRIRKDRWDSANVFFCFIKKSLSGCGMRFYRQNQLVAEWCEEKERPVIQNTINMEACCGFEWNGLIGDEISSQTNVKSLHLGCSLIVNFKLF